MIPRPLPTWSWRILVPGLLVLLIAAGAVIVLPAALARPAGAVPGGSPADAQVLRNPLVRQAAKSDVSPPLSSIPARLAPGLLAESEGNDNPPLPKKYSPKGTVDGALQKFFSRLVMPAPIANFDGEYNQYGPIPPDTDGDVGRNHYIQIVNSGFTIYDKSGSGIPLYGPTNNNTLFTGFGGLCETLNAGDPVALYDPLADRWVLNWFTGQSNPTHQCIAVSAGPNPLGAWYRYDFVTSPVTTAFEDYPHMGVWPDAYYMTTNEFGTTNGGGNYAFERPRMLSGDPAARMLYFPSVDGGLLPSDFDGSILPPAGSPNYFFEWFNPSPGLLNEYKFHVDWTTGTGTFTGPIAIPVADFNYPTCGAARERCVPQPGTTAQLEVIGDRLMYRVAYRNFGGYESIVMNHTVNATGGSPGVAAPRWYELRDPNNALGATVFQQGTFYPGDGVFRWMGSIAQDRNGDIAMGYSAANAQLFPSIRYAGRLPTDPPGTFGQGEATLFSGSGSEDFPTAPRWGDYSNISVDPVDDCTFWYTQEYFAQTGLRNWRTRIGSFKFPQCTAQGTPTPVATATGAVPTVTRTATATPTACAGSIVVTDSIANTDPIQTGRLGLGDPKSSCAVPKAVSALSDTLTRHYKSYNFTNTSGNPQCVLVSITQNCGDNGVQSVAYLGSFNPASIQTNYLADGGASGHSFSYSFTLPAGQTAVVVVVEVSPNLGCASYNLSISACPPATPTLTAVPPTLTSTAVPPTVTRTAVPPTATSTSVPPTATRTAVPPTATRTNVPPTNTRTSVPPTATSTTCATETPIPIVTPAFTPRPGCSSTPPPGVLSAVIIDHPTTTEARFTNHSATCSYPIGLAVYRKFDNNLEHQVLYDYQLAVIPPNSTLTLTVNNPSCAFQGDAFYGNLIVSFQGGLCYCERRLDDTDGNGTNYCQSQCLPTPPPTVPATLPPPPPTLPPTVPPPPPTVPATLPPPPTCPPGTPTRIPTPAFTPAPGCSSRPRSGDLDALIIDHPTTTEARFTNRSHTCSYPIGLAVYRKFDNNINHQELYDYRLAVIPPNSTLTLVVNNPSCAYQADAFYGALIEAFAPGVRYGQRLLDDTDGNGHNYCQRPCLPPPPPTGVAPVVPNK